RSDRGWHRSLPRQLEGRHRRADRDDDHPAGTRVDALPAGSGAQVPAEGGRMKVVRAVTEAEAIGEFLKNEFYEADYNRDRDDWEQFVLHPDYTNAEESA